jgi:nucleotide-binding universal stress UspA family protein
MTVVVNPPRTILVPTDFSEPADVALDYAVALAIKLDATVHLLNVVDLQGSQFADLGALLTPETIETIVSGNRTALERRARARRETGRIGDVLLRTGDPRDVIDEVARQSNADLIVMGTHGRRGVRRMMLGSVAETIVRTASCPVLTVHPPM